LFVIDCVINSWNNWEIGLTSIFLDALGIAPFKDDFLTSTNEPGNPYQGVKGEPFPDFQAAVATLAAGPIWPSSGLTFTNWTLLHRSVRADGRILRADRPATLPDQLIYQYVFDRKSADGPSLEDNYAMTTSVNHEDGTTYQVGAIPKAKNCKSMDISQTCFHVQPVNQATSQVTMRSFHAPTSGIDSSLCGWEYYGSHLAIMPLYIGGEQHKWVPMSKQRVVRSEQRDGQHNLTLIGAPNEKVVFTHSDISKNPAIQYADPCQLDERGHARLDYDAQDLTHYRCNGQLMPSSFVNEISFCDEAFPMPSIDHLLPHRPAQAVMAQE
jgi:hypothetical protein